MHSLSKPSLGVKNKVRRKWILILTYRNHSCSHLLSVCYGQELGTAVGTTCNSRDWAAWLEPGVLAETESSSVFAGREGSRCTDVWCCRVWDTIFSECCENTSEDEPISFLNTCRISCLLSCSHHRGTVWLQEGRKEFQSKQLLFCEHSHAYLCGCIQCFYTKTL
jgi:hypothetical protein